MSYLELFHPTARQLASRQLAQAQRLALEHAAQHEQLLVEAARHASLCTMYRERAARIGDAMGLAQDSTLTFVGAGGTD